MTASDAWQSSRPYSEYGDYPKCGKDSCEEHLPDKLARTSSVAVADIERTVETCPKAVFDPVDAHD